MTEGSDRITVQLTAASGVAVLAALIAVIAVTLVGPAAASAPALSCATGDAGVHYTAPSNLTVADASNATVDSPFAGNQSIAVGDVTVSADGTAFARVETATGETCLSDLDATTVPVTVESDAATVTVEGSVDALAFEDPAADEVAFAYRAENDLTVTLADAGHPAGTTLRVLDAESDRELDGATVASDGSLALSLPASEDGTRVRLITPPETADTAGQTPTERATAPSSTAAVRGDGGAPASGTDGADDDGGGPLWPLVAVLALLVIGAITARRRFD